MKVLSFILALVGLILGLIAQRFSRGIESLTFGQMAEETVEYIISVIVGIFTSVINQEYAIKEVSFDLNWNVMFPMLLYFLAVVAIFYSCYLGINHLESGSRFYKIIEIVILMVIASMGTLFIYQGGKLLLIGVALAAITFGIFAFFILMLFSLFNTKETR